MILNSRAYCEWCNCENGLFLMWFLGIKPLIDANPIKAPIPIPVHLYLDIYFVTSVALSRFPVYVRGMENDPPKAAMITYGPLPAVGVPVQVQCVGHRCMAFRDREGRWVDLFSREFVPHVLGVVPA